MHLFRLAVGTHPNRQLQMDYMIWPDGDEMVLVKNDTQPSGPLFTPDSIMGLIWQENWESKKLAEKDPDDIQKEYVRFCLEYKIHAPCWEPIGPYPVPKPKSVQETSVGEAQDPENHK